MSWSEVYIQDRCRQLSEPFRERELERRRLLAEACAITRPERDVQGTESFPGRIAGRLLTAAAALVKPGLRRSDSSAGS